MSKKAKPASPILFPETKQIPAANIELSVVPAKKEIEPETAKELGKTPIVERSAYADYGVLPEDQRVKLFPRVPPLTLKQLKNEKSQVRTS